jgi:hypothetical protein
MTQWHLRKGWMNGQESDSEVYLKERDVAKFCLFFDLGKNVRILEEEVFLDMEGQHLSSE